MLAITIRDERKITLNTIGIIVVAILVVIVAVVTGQRNEEAQIRKIYDKYFFDITEGKKKLANENEELQKEKLELAQQLSRAKNDIKIVEDTYKTKIDELENEIVNLINLNYKKQLEDETLELGDILEPTEVQEDEDQETKD